MKKISAEKMFKPFETGTLGTNVTFFRNVASLYPF